MVADELGTGSDRGAGDGLGGDGGLGGLGLDLSLVLGLSMEEIPPFKCEQCNRQQPHEHPAGVAVAGPKLLHFQVAKFGANAWNWVPDGLRTVCREKTRGCRCHGTGSLGQWVDHVAGPGSAEIKREIPCPCLHVEISTDELPKLMSQVVEHYNGNLESGNLCGCMFCMQKRQLQEQN